MLASGVAGIFFLDFVMIDPEDERVVQNGVPNIGLFDLSSVLSSSLIIAF